MHELIDYITEFELSYAEIACKYMKPDAFFQHDDWGSQISTFFSPDMFEEFFLPRYKKLYGYYKTHGCQVIMHHSDSYAATLVPYMIDIGIDIWQGVMRTNKIEELIPKYGDKIAFMGGVDSATIDYPGWTEEVVEQRVREACENYGKFGKGFIPSASQGLPMSTFPGVYEATSKYIDKMSAEMFPRK
jgi:uroporphyrinogen-III decarboxylase